MSPIGTANFQGFANLNWEGTEQICYNNYYHEISISFNQSANSQGTIYFESVELAQKAIEEVGEDRLKKYVFNVKE